jgi:hypothetical protein
MPAATVAAAPPSVAAKAVSVLAGVVAVTVSEDPGHAVVLASAVLLATSVAVALAPVSAVGVSVTDVSVALPPVVLVVAVALAPTVLLAVSVAVALGPDVVAGVSVTAVAVAFASVTAEPSVVVSEGSSSIYVPPSVEVSVADAERVGVGVGVAAEVRRLLAEPAAAAVNQAFLTVEYD